jgi:hypothetical protein
MAVRNGIVTKVDMKPITDPCPQTCGCRRGPPNAQSTTK